jgi:SAM-dependent methyltransferase
MGLNISLIYNTETFMKDHTYSCPICYKNRYQILFISGIYINKITISICRHCGLISQNPRRSQKYFNQYYSNKQYYGSYQQEVNINRKPDFCRNTRPVKIYKHINKYLAKTDNILEIGAGLGDNLLYLQKKNYKNVFATDLNKNCQMLLNKRGIECFEGNLKNYHIYDKNQYNLIIASHLIEHLVHPERELEQISRMLKKNGMLYVLLPDVTSDNPYSQFTLPHIFYFSPETLKDMLTRNGFEIVESFGTTDKEQAILCRVSRKLKSAHITCSYQEAMEYINKYKLPKKGIKERIADILGNYIPEKYYLEYKKYINIIHG